MLKIGEFTIERPYILAPMAGVSQKPFRCLALKHGAGLAPTELISSKGLMFNNLRTKTYLTYDNAIEKPFYVQLFGGEKESMAIAAERALEMGAQIIDINMGCPVKKVTKTNAGSALLCDIDRAVDIVSAMYQRTAYKIPITAKIRSGFTDDDLNYLKVGRALEDAGIKALSLHARTRSQGYSGKANWDHIKRLKDALNIPVIGNGDVVTVADAQRMFKETACDAVMIGRGALGNPWIFRDLTEGEKAVDKNERWQLVREHLDEHIKLMEEVWISEPHTKNAFCKNFAVKSFRSHLLWYSKGLYGGSSYRQKVTQAETYNETFELSEEFFLTHDAGRPEECTEDGIDYRQAFG